MGKKYLVILSVLILGGLVVSVSGCTSSSNAATYKSDQMEFKYPSSWSKIEEGTNWVRFKASTGEVRVWVYPKDSGQLSSFTFSDNEKVGNRNYTKIVDGGITSYAFKGNNSDLFIIASTGNQEGIKQIIETVDLK